MTQGPSNGQQGMANEDGMFSRREHRVALLNRASQAVRSAHVASEQAGKVRAALLGPCVLQIGRAHV